jgi:hypothetical protein
MNYTTWPCKQKAVYWPPGSEATGGRDFDDYGRPMYTTAIEIDCRWDDTTEAILLPNGEQVMSRAIVIVDREVKNGGVLWLGNLVDVTDVVNPKKNDGAFEIRRVDKNPDIDANETLVRAYL